ncbi:MAG: nucleoside monophosphate kinase [Opitutae bacterium]|nr:nucleoside monophosphate kinase [Opitutae bacterium]MBT7740812.1 nucleoside monophosphate kinase [Opitutae bacterium]MBT7925204.1 nucleoside monophosphate kinase [Opitutae bacterium]
MAKSKEKTVLDLEVKDAQLIFQSVWQNLESELDGDNMHFPAEIFWLNGAPGAGKGTQTAFIMEFRDFTEKPIVVSDLLKSPEARKMMDAGMLAGDREVTELVFRRLLDPIYDSGAIIDGFPRTKTQVECLKLMYQRLNELRIKHLGTEKESQFPKPRFHIIMLFVDENESVRRQLARGKRALEYNREVEASGVGNQILVRKTDLDEEAAHNRYKTFKEATYDSLRTLREVFHYHFINAQGTVIEVQQRIIHELKYQSSLELDEGTYDRISTIPLADKISLHARQLLVNRLDSYEKLHTALFEQVVELIKTKFIPIVEKHSISGLAYINSEDPVFENPLSIAMLIDVFTERGFTAVVDIRRMEVPIRMDRETYEIINRVKKIYRVRINFPGSKIRRGL